MSRPDLDEQLLGAVKLHRESNGLVSWAASFDARPFERPDSPRPPSLV